MKCNHEYNLDYLSNTWICQHCGDKQIQDDKTDFVVDIRDHVSPNTLIKDC